MNEEKLHIRIREELTPKDVEEMYEQVLCDIYGMVNVCGCEYSACQVLKEFDPTAFRCGMNDWLDSECQDDRLYEIDGEYYDMDEVKEIEEGLEREESENE